MVDMVRRKLRLSDDASISLAWDYWDHGRTMKLEDGASVYPRPTMPRLIFE